MNNIKIGRQKQLNDYEYNIKCIHKLKYYLKPIVINYDNWKMNGFQIPFDIEKQKNLVDSLLNQFNALYFSNNQPNQLYQIIGISYLSYMISSRLQIDSLQELLDKLQINDFKNIPKKFQPFFIKEKLILMIREIIYSLKKSESPITHKGLIKLINKVPLFNFAIIIIFRGIALLGYRQWSIRLIDFQNGNQQELILDFQKKATLFISKYIIQKLKINLKIIRVSNHQIQEQNFFVQFCQNNNGQIKILVNKNRIYLLTQTVIKQSSQQQQQPKMSRSNVYFKKSKSLIFKRVISIKNQKKKQLQLSKFYLKQQKQINKQKMIDASVSAELEELIEENLKRNRMPGKIMNQKELLPKFFQRILRSYQNHKIKKYRFNYVNQLIENQTKN